MKTHIKICGITNLKDASVAAAAGADLLGFILYPKSPRYATPNQVAQIVEKLVQQFGEERPRCVGVFVNEPLEHVESVLAQTGLDLAQLHGDEPAEMLQALHGRAYKALRPSSADKAHEQAERFAPLGPVARPTWMIDAYDPNAYGGTGHKADWSVAHELGQRYSGLLLAGGLTPENVAQAMEAVQPWGVDVASGVEAEPGRKDHEKVRAFIEAVRSREDDA